MLQYSVQLPPLSLSSPKHSAKDHSDYFRSNDSSHLQSSSLNSKRFQKESFAPRSPVVPFSISTNHSPLPSPVLASAKPPRSPYISSRPLSFPPARTWSSKHPSSASSVSSCAVEDVLATGDVVGQDVLLQGEAIRLVSLGSTPCPSDALDYKEPAKEFEVVRRLGTGSYAVVYLVREVLSRPPPSDDGHMSIGSMEMDGSLPSHPVYGREYAIKCLSKANLDEEALAAQMSEVTIHQSLQSHSNIVTLHRTLETSSFLLLLLEYVPGEDLFYFLEQARDHFDSNTAELTSPSRTPPTPSLLSNLHPSQLLSHTRLRLISSMFSQMCDAVAACHAQQVFHRDIKPENFIVTDGWIKLPNDRQERKVIVKLTDFGLSTSDIESSDMDCGSAPYMSYECRNNVAPTYRPRAADVWSLGIVLINMLYHYNPWTDTSQGACSSFDLFLRDPINFFLVRFNGMTRPVAEFFANKVFCILDGPEDDSRRITASEFGTWVKDLPALLGGPAALGMQRAASSSSIHGHSISSTPISCRPTSRHPSGTASALRTPAIQSRSLSRAPSLGPAFEMQEKSELSTVIDQESEEQDLEDQDGDIEVEGMTSRSTSTNKRRKRGARKGKGIITTPNDETLATLAVASQSLAREISKASRSSSHSTRAPVPTAPVLSAIQPPPVTKKPSKWKLSFGKNNATASNGRVSPVEEVSPPTSFDGGSQSMSATASNVTNLIMGLSAPAPPPPPPSSASVFDDNASTWSRGRRQVNASNNRMQGYGLSSSPPTGENWGYIDRRSERAISPNSIRSGRPVASSASSIASSNWRNSTSTTSSAGTSTSAFTRYSNSSTRSISTTATSVSSTSWRTGTKSQAPSSNSAYATIPKNIKLMNGVPWELDQLPRGQHPNPVGDIFGSPPIRKQRTRKPKDPKLDTITERPGAQRPQYQRRDASTSTTDLDGLARDGEGDGSNKKVQKGQINALAKMLSALRR